MQLLTQEMWVWGLRPRLSSKLPSNTLVSQNPRIPPSLIIASELCYKRSANNCPGCALQEDILTFTFTRRDLEIKILSNPSLQNLSREIKTAIPSQPQKLKPSHVHLIKHHWSLELTCKLRMLRRMNVVKITAVTMEMSVFQEIV